MTASVYWFGAPWHGILAGKVPKHAVCVQHVYDELAISPIYDETQKSCMAHWEAELLRRCEACFCSSVPQVKARQRPDAKCAIELLQNAVSEEYFNAPASRCPIALIERMKSIPRPRIVYGGVADLRLDGALLSQCVEKLPHAQFVFLGKQDASLDTQFARFAHDHPRVHFFGSLPYLAFPTLYAEADALMIAHKRMAFTDAMYPEKLNEYLASGKPVVSVALPEVQRIAAEAADPRAVRVAADAREYVALIEESLGEKNEQLAQARINLAHKHTWSIEADTLNQRLREMLSR